jgi:hypothetical protein
MSLRIYVDHAKLRQFEELALDIARECNTGLRIEVNFNREKTKAVANIMLFDVSKEKCDED